MAGKRRGTIRTPKVRERFLKALRAGAPVEQAAVIAGASKSSIYRWRLEDTKFREEWDEALDYGTALLEWALMKKALRMDDRASVSAAIFLLKARKPEYRDNHGFEISSEDTDEVITVKFVRASE